MRQRGKQSLEALAIPGAVAIVNRPSAPLDLTPEESDVWIATVEALPADWFPAETHPLLRQWCRHTVTARRVSQMIDAAAAREELDIAEMKELLAMQARETASLKALGASMRISQQASVHHEKAGTSKAKRATVKRPWES